MRPDDPTVVRLRRHLASVHARYPHAWDQLAALRRQKVALGGWPTWCDVPLSGAQAIVAAVTDHGGADVAVVGGLGTWRLTQGIYRYDPDLYTALIETPIDGRLPIDLLYRLPAWAVYIETPGMAFGRVPQMGALIHLEYDANDGRTEIRALVDVGDWLLPLMLHLTHDTIDEGIDAALGEALRHMPGDRILPAGAWEQSRADMRAWWPPMLSLVLYLCSEAPDVATGPGPSGVTRRRDGSIIPAAQPREWAVGARLGAALRTARADASRGGTHASPRAHIRRAHWHTYLTGPRRGDQRRVLKWLPPTPINLVDDASVIPTIHPTG